ncbi:hypothetical protein ACKKBG_A34140 [Auxenochlorella protothecoides x Auxenochlorella symbiontica]
MSIPSSSLLKRNTPTPYPHQRRTILVLCLTALLAFTTPMTKAQEQRWRNCSDAPTPLTVVEALVEPSPVQAGKEAAFMIEYESGMEVSAGILDVTVKYLGIHVYHKSGDLCSAVQCPLPAGSGSFVLKEKMPAIAPPGHYSMLVSVREPETDRQLLCVEMDFSLSSWAGALSKPFSWLMGPKLGAQRADNHAAGAFVVDH